MENIIPITDFHGQEGIQAVSARALYTFLYGHDAETYARWARKNISENEYAVRGEDWVVSDTNVENPQGGRPSLDFALRLDFAKKLAMMARSEQGDRIRNYFLAIEAQARLVTLQDQWNLPRSFSEALLALAHQVEANDKANATIAAQAPLVAYAEKVQGSVNSATVDQTAKTLGINVTAFRKFVHGKYLFQKGGEWWPYEEYGEAGRKWFELKTGSWTARSGSEIACHTTKVTGLGQVKLKEAWDRSRELVPVT